MATTYLRAESVRANPLSIFATFDRRTLANAVEVLVAVLDTIDGDPDVELNGDEQDSDGDERGDPAWIEWQTRGRHKLDAQGGERLARDGGRIVLEDDEDDDPAEADGDERDGNGSEDDFMVHAWDGPGCPIADPGGDRDEGH